MHLSERYALDVESCYINFLCKKSGAQLFQLSTSEFKELKKHEDEISKALLAIRYDGDITSSVTFELDDIVGVAASVHPESPYLHLVRGGGYEPLQLTLEEYSCITWFTAIMQNYQME